MMKRTRAELKMMARRALVGNFGTAAVSGLLSAMIVGTIFTVLYIVTVVAIMFFAAALYRGTGVVVAVTILFMIVLFLLIILAGVFLGVGYMRLCYKIAVGEKAEYSDLFYVFRNRPLKFIGASLLISLLGLLVSIPGFIVSLIGTFVLEGAASFVVSFIAWLLSYIPGTLIALRYSMVMFILIENSEYRVSDAFKQSKYLMQDNYGRLFVLSLSFIGWIILGYLSVGIGYLWITPYILCTSVYFYLSIKEEKYNMGNQM